MENDIAIMYLTEDVVTSPGVQPIELSSGPSVTHFNKDCIITGWGALTEGLLLFGYTNVPFLCRFLMYNRSIISKRNGEHPKIK